MNIIEITDINDPRISHYASLTEAQLRSRLDPSEAIFIAESPKVIKVALDHGYEPYSLLCEKKHITGDAAEIIAHVGDNVPLFTGSREVLANITGYTLTRGVLCAMKRPSSPDLKDVCKSASRIAVIDGVVDTTNIGAIFRSAAALGIDAVVLSPTSCDPFNRRSIRVSMGTVFVVPWTWCVADYHSQLSSLGFKTVAMALTDESIEIDNPILQHQPKLAIILGTEGDGLSQCAIAKSDFVARIPMSRGVDSLNVAAASAVAFWQLRKF